MSDNDGLGLAPTDPLPPCQVEIRVAICSYLHQCCALPAYSFELVNSVWRAGCLERLMSALLALVSIEESLILDCQCTIMNGIAGSLRTVLAILRCHSMCDMGAIET